MSTTSHWISNTRRKRIYARDGNLCVYCLSPDRLTLDHLKPRSKGGSHDSRNLVTACHRCNSLRGDMSPRMFCILLHGVNGWFQASLRIGRVRRRGLREPTV